MTLYIFIGLAIGTMVVIWASMVESLPLFLAGFIAMFILTGVGNGSTYKMIPAIFRSKANAAIRAGADQTVELLKARRMSGALIGFAGAVGAGGGLFINLAFRSSFQNTGSGGHGVHLVPRLLRGVRRRHLRGVLAQGAHGRRRARACLCGSVIR